MTSYFMDHMMPRMDGIEAVRIIRSLGYTGSVVALTAHATAGQAEVFLSNGFDDFISKPIDVHQLDAVLNKLIRGKHSPKTTQGIMEKTVTDNTPLPAVNPKTVNNFVQDAEKALAVLEEIYAKRDAFADEDLHSYVINTHAMKSALANIGETVLSGTARTLETAGRERDIGVITAETPDFLNRLRAVIKRIVPAEKDEGSKITDADQAYLHERMLAFQEACGAYNKKAAKDILVELKQKNWPLPVKEILNTMAEHLVHSEFDEAVIIALDWQ